MNQKYAPVSFRSLGEKLPNPNTIANNILKEGGGGGNTKKLPDYIRLACGAACKGINIEQVLTSYRASAKSISKNPPTDEEIELGTFRIRAFKAICKKFGLRHASTEYILTLPMNDVVRVSGRIDHTLIDEQGTYWFILFKEKPSGVYEKEYMYPFIQHTAQQQLHYLLNGIRPKVGIYEHSTPSFNTFNYSTAQEEQLIQDVINWADKVANLVQSNSGGDSQSSIF